VVIHTNTATI